MNLKEAFRFQNKLQSMMADAQSILGNNGNIMSLSFSTVQFLPVNLNGAISSTRGPAIR